MSTNSLHLMIVDDDKDDIDFLKSAIQRNHEDVYFTTCYSGTDAINTLMNGKKSRMHPSLLPDLIFLDLNMPAKNGFQTYDEIRADTSLSGIPIIILTSSNLEQDRLKFKDKDFVMFFTKPMTMEEYDDIATTTILFLNATA